MDLPETPSRIFIDELIAGEDERFFEFVRKVHAPGVLESIVDRWKKDSRPWATRQVVAYFGESLDSPGHELVVKRLFKDAEEKKSDDVIAACAVAFDRLIRRRRKRKTQFDYQSRSFDTVEYLASPHDRIPQVPKAIGSRGAPHYYPIGERLFSYKTRYYLRRRVWRYFRRVSYSSPERYVEAIAKALASYIDDDFASGENIIDNWTMIHACYFHHEIFKFTATKAELTEGRTLNELTAAPYQEQLWKQSESFDVLFALLVDAKSSLIRQWSLELLKRHHEPLFKSLSPMQLMPLMNHADERVQNFAAEAFANLDNLGSVGIDVWLELLKTSNISVLTLICDAMRKHVAVDRLDSQQLLNLACVRPDPVARMGLELVRKRHADRPYALSELSLLANVECASIAHEAATWALTIVGASQSYHVDFVSPFFDSLQFPTRIAAMSCLDESSPGWNDPTLWARLVETPFDDVRLGVVSKLEKRRRLPGRETDRLAPVWSAVVLNVNRGGRRKPDALRQIINAILEEPAQAERLIPVVAVAVRSIRASERRAALASLASLLESMPEQRARLAEAIPELEVPSLIGGPN